MSINWRYVVGATTIVGIVSFTAYSIYAYKKQQKEEENYITLEDAKELAEKRKREIAENKRQDDIQKVDKEVQPTPVFNDPFLDRYIKPEVAEKLVDNRDEEIEEALEDESEVIFDDNIELEDEGEGKLRHDPNSDAALQQYIESETVLWQDDKWTYDILRRLFEIEFEPLNDGDLGLHEALASNRSNFFGKDSRWNNYVTFGDVILHFAHHLDFNLNGTVVYWGRRLVILSGLADYIPDINDTEELEMAINDMNKHIFYNGRTKTHGLFGLDDISLDNARNTASKNIDNELTYEIEYQEFLKQWQREEM